jgi:hypothetical protein
MCTDNSVIRSRSAASVALNRRSVIFSPFLATPPSGVHRLHEFTCRLFPWGTVRWSAVAGTAGQVPKQPFTLELPKA